MQVLIHEVLMEGPPQHPVTHQQRVELPPLPTCGNLMGNIACKCPPKSGSQYFNIKVFCSVVFIDLVDADYKFNWADHGCTGSVSDAKMYNNSEI